MRIIGKVLMASCLAILAISCEKEEQADKRVALFLPDGVKLERWTTDMSNLVDALAQYGLETSQYTAPETAEGAEEQAVQIQNAIKSGIKNFVITPIDYQDLNNRGVFDGHNDLHIVCHDRIIPLNTKIACYSSCQREQLGVMQAQFLIQQYKASGKATMTLEMFAGPTSDDNAECYFNGAYELLEPYIDGGKLIVKSNLVSYKAVALEDWSKEEGGKKFEGRLHEYFEKGEYPDLILGPNDAVACGIVSVLDTIVAKDAKYPAITGQDNTSEARNLIAAGKMSMTVDKSLKSMAYNTALVVSSLVNGVSPMTTEEVKNGLVSVPLITSQLTLVTSDNLNSTRSAE